MKVLQQSLHTNEKLQDKIVEIAKIPKKVTNIQKQENNTFNLKNFLNIECKDAMNLTDFVDQIILTLKELNFFINQK